MGDDASAWPLLISEGDVTLDLNGHVLDLKKKNICIYSNVNLTLTDSSPKAEHKFRVENSGLWVWDETRGTKTVAGGVITGGTGVEGGSGTIGTLGGGVNVSGGNLTMNGGSIVGCTANSGGGVGVSGGSFTMNGGRITGCTAVKSGNNYGSGGGVRVDENSSFTMASGSIEGCTAADAGGGVDAYGDSFTMKSGTIEKCKAGNGGGVNLSNNSFTMEGGSIVGCSANNGGGIYVQPNSLCKLTMTGGSITNCTAAYAGGGVYLSSSGSQSGSFTMEGGSITDCTAGGADNAVHAGGTFTDKTGTIDRKLVSGINAGHTGTADDPILIATTEGLKDFRDKVNGGQTGLCAKLLCDIVLNDGTFDENGKWSKQDAPEPWTPIGTDTKPYTGTFDGGGHTIKGLYVNVNGDYFAGLFGYTDGATIKNVTVDGYVSISGNFSDDGQTANVAGIVACAMNTSITGCTNLCTVKSDSSATSGSYVGGIVGNMYCTGNTEYSITNCRNGGKVILISGIDSLCVGGIAGHANAPVSGCCNTGDIKAAYNGTKLAELHVGGVVGRKAGSTVNDCYNTGAVTVEGDFTVPEKNGTGFSGVVGICSINSTVSNCYNVGEVTYTGNCEQVNSGGIVGMNAISTVTDCYYLTGTAEKAVGLEYISATTERAEAKTGAEFADGTVLELLKQNGTTGAWGECGYLAAAGMTLPLLSWQTADAHTHSGGTATCKDKAICEICGESYGELNANNHTDLKHVPAVAATKTAEGNIEYWYCSGCGKYYKDAKATQKITKADTVTAKLPSHTGGGTGAGTGNKPGNDTVASPNTGDSSKLALWSVTLCTSLAACLTLTKAQRRRKKEQ